MSKRGLDDGLLYLRCANVRLDEAGVLYGAAYHTGAVYLAGYAIECILKALILSTLPASEKRDTAMSFRGQKAHEYSSLRYRYLTLGGAPFPREIIKHLTTVNVWSTDLRYKPESVRPVEAERFLASAKAIVQWAKRRL